MMVRIVTFALLLLLPQCLAQENQVFDKPILIEKSDLPEVPKVLKKSNITGVALIRVTVSESGTIDDVGMVRSTNLSPLDKFLTGWVREWTFLPKLHQNETAPGFTIVSIRYDLARNSFESPPVNSLAMVLPEPYMRLWSGESAPKASSVVTSRMDSASPVRSLQTESIPDNLKQTGVVIDTVIEVKVGKDGKLNSIERPDTFDPDSLWEWLVKELKRMEWQVKTDSEIRIIRIPLKLNLQSGSIEIGECRYIAP